MPVIEAGAINVLEREKNQPIHQWVYKVLRTAIIEIHIRPTQALSEKEISDLLGVSRTPVREAFIRLAEDGLINITPQKRSIVSPIDLDQAEEARFVRRALEKAVIKEACGRLTDEDRSALESNIETQRECRAGRPLTTCWSWTTTSIASSSAPAARKGAGCTSRSWTTTTTGCASWPCRRDRQVIAEHRQIREILIGGSVDRVDQAIDGHLTTRRSTGSFGSTPRTISRSRSRLERRQSGGFARIPWWKRSRSKEETVKKILCTTGVILALVLAPVVLFAKPVKLSIIDVAGNLRLSKPAIEAFKAANPQIVSDIEYIIA